MKELTNAQNTLLQDIERLKRPTIIKLSRFKTYSVA